jgi:hypothetical protein
MNIKTVNQVFQTEDYSLFKSLDGNRHVNSLHVRRLKDSFKGSYLFSPILVNEKYEIIDGQHRFEAAKELNLPIVFIVVHNYGLKEVQILNENMKNWTKADYLSAYCDLKHPEYLKFRNFMRQFPDFGIVSCEMMLTGLTAAAMSSGKSKYDRELVSQTNKKGEYRVRYFQEGDLVIPSYENAVEIANKILMIKPYYDGFNRVTFVRAMMGIFNIEYYDHTQLIDRIKTNPKFLQHCGNVTQTRLMIEELYNFRSREKVSLRY